MRNDRHSSAQVLEAFDGLNFTTVAVLSAVNAAESSIFHENYTLNVACRYESMSLVRYLEERGLISNNDRERDVKLPPNMAVLNSLNTST